MLLGFFIYVAARVELAARIRDDGHQQLMAP
jgi:hypothetical protein